MPLRNVPLRIVFIADAARAWDWCAAPTRQGLLESEDPRNRVRELSAGPWTRTALDLWLKDHTDLALPPEDILRRTGGWDRAINILWGKPRLSSAEILETGSHENVIDDLRQLRPAIKVLHAFNEIVTAGGEAEMLNEETLTSWDPNLTSDQIVCALAWAQLVGIIQPSKSGPELNPLIREALPLLAVA
jgi:hypothetical protein